MALLFSIPKRPSFLSKKRREVALAADRYWHLGGFCFGHDKTDREVGRLQGRLEWSGKVPLHKAGRMGDGG